VPAAEPLPRELLAGAASVAVRVPASEVARALARLAGPLVATSANLAGDPVCPTVDLALRAFPGAALAFDAGPLEGAPSTIVDLAASPGGFTVLRDGRVDKASIERVLGRAAPNVPPAEAMAPGFGWPIIDHCSSRHEWRHGHPVLIGKSIPGFFPLGPCVVTPPELHPPHPRDRRGRGAEARHAADRH